MRCGCPARAGFIGATGAPLVVESLVSLAVTRIQQCTQMPQFGAEMPSRPICVHYCILRPSRQRNSVHKCPNSAPRGSRDQSVYTIASPRLLAAATVYTNGSKRCREALTTDLCTLLRPEAAHHPRATTVYTNGSNRLRDALATNLCTLLRPPFTHNVRFSSRASVPRLFTAMRYRAACLAGGLSRWGREITRMKGLCVWGVPWHCTSPLPVPLEVFAMESRSRFA